MRETIAMSTIEQRRAWVLTKVVAGEVEVAEAAELLGLSVRSVWRLKRRFAEEGPSGLVHGNRGPAFPVQIRAGVDTNATNSGRMDDRLVARLGASRGTAYSDVSVRP